MGDFEEETCCFCFVRFGVPIGFVARRRADKRDFWCPNGHGMSYTESELDKVRRERDRLAQKISEKDDEIRTANDRIERTERRLSAAAGHVTKLKNKAARGECPCCHKSFVQLWTHMRKEHKGFLAEPINGDALMIEGPR